MVNFVIGSQTVSVTDDEALGLLLWLPDDNAIARHQIAMRRGKDDPWPPDEGDREILRSAIERWFASDAVADVPASIRALRQALESTPA